MYYPEFYFEGFRKKLADLFYEVGCTSCNVFKTLDTFLVCKVFHDIGAWQVYGHLDKTIAQLLESVSFDEGFDWRNSEPTDDVDPTILWWVGLVIAQFHWEYCIDFKDWRKYFSVKDVYNMYYPLHEASLSNAASKLYTNYEYARQHASK